MKRIVNKAVAAFRNPALRGVWFFVLFVLPLSIVALRVGETTSVERGTVHGVVVEYYGMDGKRGPVTRTLRVRLDSGQHVLVNVVERTVDRKGARVSLREVEHTGGWPRTTYVFEDYE